ncbi:MAG: MATE family efflux transporter [Spirochaetaceae bacterium]|jgi:putative MATE family efflux protein|nr:MATE family efflux transporter [Spirochaetaceae bacterium]
MTKNLTVGSPALLILSFAAPLFVGNLFQQCYNMADTVIVGRTIGVAALAAVGCTGSINFLVLGFVIGFTQGASIITSQRFGAGDEAGVRRSFAASILLGLGLTAALMLLSILSARLLLRFLKTPEEILDAAYAYIVVIYAGIGAAVLFNLCSNIMRALGDSRTPLYFLALACILNIILDLVFIRLFHTGVAGAAYATVIAQLLSGILCIPVIIKKIPQLRITWEDFRRLTLGELWIHINGAVPMGFQYSIIAIGTVTVQFALNRLGLIPVAAFTASQKIDQFATMPMASFGTAMSTYAAQNYGAGKIERIRKGLMQTSLISCAFSLLMGLLYFVAGHHFAAIFIGNEPEAIRLAHRYLRINGSFYLFLACLFIFRQTLQGLGDGLIPTVAGIMELLMRTFAAIILSARFGFTGLCFAGPLAYIGACIPLTAAVVFTLRKLPPPRGV